MGRVEMDGSVDVVGVKLSRVAGLTQNVSYHPKISRGDSREKWKKISEKYRNFSELKGMHLQFEWAQ